MNPNDTDERQAELNDLIEAFEAAHARHDAVELSEFLPAAEHPLYLEARRELLRVDLELSWLDGRRHRFQDYVEQFPDLLQDRAAVQEVTFEEFRLRTLAGETPLPTEYEERYGVATTGWTPSQNVAAGPKTADDPRTDVALFLNIARTLSQSESWHSSHHGEAAQALLQQNVHQSSDEAIFLLTQAMTALPEVGSTFLSFQLIAELGHGSFGRVYLAHQGDLANRLVALKITVDLLGEEQKLAQLQHTNVVPIYSVHQAGPLQAVCMPYFGPTTLADVIRATQNLPTVPIAGTELVRTLRDRKAAFLAQVRKEMGADQSQSATLKMLAESSYSDAILSIAEGVTEGLIHAHERGILHRDLKPANILLTDEGRPMLVDFNLSADVKLHAGLSDLRVGGTLPYMAPETLDAMQGAGRATDARSDLYALGIVLFELLTGRLPFETPPGHLSEILPAMIAQRLQARPRLRRLNPGISPAVESIVCHCLHADPAKRYQSATELHEDLKRQRRHYPLRYAPEPSIRERAQKWERRHPHLASPSSVGGIAIFLVLCCMAPFAWQAWGQWQSAMEERAQIAAAETNKANLKTSRAEGTAQAQQAQIDALEKFREFEKTSASARPIIEIVSVMQMLPEAGPYEHKRLVEAMADCQRALQIYHVFEDAPWQRQPAVRELPAPERDELRRKIAALLYALAYAEQANFARCHDQGRSCTIAIAALTLPGVGREVWGAWEAIIQSRAQSAAAMNERACACYEGQVIPWYLAHQKATLQHLRGGPYSAERFPMLTEEIQGNEDPDVHFFAAATLVAEGRFGDALPWLGAATERSPNHAGAWLLLAWCHYNVGDSKMAESCYDSYLTLQPEGIWGYYSRGLLSLSKRNWAAAEHDFSKVLERHPDLAWAYSHRAAARNGIGKHNLKAIEDLSRAIRLAPQIPEFYLLRAKIHATVGNSELAEVDRRHFLLHEPSDFTGWLYRGIAQYEREPKDALMNFEKALAVNPDSPLTLFKKACLLADAFGRSGDAVNVLDKVIEQNPISPMPDSSVAFCLPTKRGIALPRWPMPSD